MIKEKSFKPANLKSKQKRGQTGNMLVLSTAITIGLMMALLFFALNYARLLGSNNEQRTCIEMAALEAAKQLSNLVIEDPNFGPVGLSDYAPTGKGTIAGDMYATPVRSINSILATNRLLFIIADKINLPQMRTAAELDYIKAMAAKDRLVDALRDAVKKIPSRVYTDRDGNRLDIYRAAETAYNTNRIRMAERSYYVAGSLELTLGSVADAPTNTPVPKPIEFAAIDSDDEQNGYYKSARNIPYGGRAFVFAPTTSNIALVDPKKFTLVQPLPYDLPGIVQAKARQHLNIWGASGANVDNDVEAVACAEPACVRDPRPFPGALTISFPDGKLENTIRMTRDIITLSPFRDERVRLQRAKDKDYPRGGGHLEDEPTLESVSSFWSKKLLPDWLKQKGETVDIASVVRFQTASLGPQGNNGSVNVFEFRDGDIIQYRVVTNEDDVPDLPVGHEQLTAQVKRILPVYDLSIYDYAAQPGRLAEHAGQPLPFNEILNPDGRDIQAVNNFHPFGASLIAKMGIDCGIGGSGCGGEYLVNQNALVIKKAKKRKRPYDFPTGRCPGEPRMLTYRKNGLVCNLTFAEAEAEPELGLVAF